MYLVRCTSTSRSWASWLGSSRFSAVFQASSRPPSSPSGRLFPCEEDSFLIRVFSLPATGLPCLSACRHLPVREAAAARCTRTDYPQRVHESMPRFVADCKRSLSVPSQLVVRFRLPREVVDVPLNFFPSPRRPSQERGERRASPHPALESLLLAANMVRLRPVAKGATAPRPHAPAKHKHL